MYFMEINTEGHGEVMPNGEARVNVCVYIRMYLREVLRNIRVPAIL